MTRRITTLAVLLLATPGFAAEPAQTVKCLDESAIVSKTIDDGVLLVTVLGGKTYRNRAAGNCRSLERWRPGEALIFEQQGSRLCRGDRLRVADSIVPGAACILGRFQEVPRPAKE